MTRVEELADVLHHGGHSLVLQHEGEIHAYDGRGVSDLLCLLDTAPQLLSGAVIADKVVGKAAAAIMLAGGVKALYADVISHQALQLLASAEPHVDVAYDMETDHIINRSRTGWCPMELACRDCSSAAECVVRIRAKIAEMRSASHGATIHENNRSK